MMPWTERAPLRPGDVVWLVALSGPQAADGLHRACTALEGWGLDVRLGEHIADVDARAPYLAGSDDHRRADLLRAWTDPEASAVVCIRGGYGSQRILDGLDPDELRAHALRADGTPKLLAGSSDVTAVHQYWDRHLGLPTLFCPMPGNTIFRDAGVQADIRSWLLEPWGGREIGGENARTLVPGRARGRITGGTLSLLAGSIGAQESAGRRDRGPVLTVLEDVDEELYRLDGMLTQLLRTGWLGGEAGLALGSWHDCAPVPEVEALVLEALGAAGIPIVSELGFGHDPHAPALPFGVEAVLEAEEHGRARLLIPRG